MTNRAVVLAAVITALSLLSPFLATSHAAEPSPGAGISGIAGEPVVRVLAPDAPSGKQWLYQVALPFQVSPTQAALFCNVREAMAQGVDFEVGNDVMVFSSLAELADAVPVVANRNNVEPNPKSMPAGKPATMVKYPIRGGFVPLGAKRGDGTPHPQAGTGFGLGMVQAWKILQEGPPPYLQNSYSGAEAFGYWEFQQYTFDGTTFRVTATERVPFKDLLPPWQFTNGGIGNAVADGDDLLVPMVGKGSLPPAKASNAKGDWFNGSGLLRMRRIADAWRPVEFLPVPQASGTIEPSVVRDLDGSLLFAARGGSFEGRRNDIRVRRSQDGGRTWSDLIEVRGVISPGPITLNQAADGTPYVAANLREVMLGAKDPLALLAAERKVKVEPGRDTRNTLSIWPLTASRNALAEPIDVLDGRAEFGPPAGSNWTWRADHPSGMTVRLADGKWHHLLGTRVQDYREIKEAMPPTAHTGMYVYEVLSRGEPHPVWKF